MADESILIKVNYINPAAHIFDANKIEIINDRPRLKLVDKSLNYNQAFDNDAGFTYDNSKSEFVAGILQQKNMAGANAIFGGNFDTAIDLDWRTDALAITGIANGSPTISTGRIRCNTGNGVSWAKTTAAIETFKFRYAPLFTGTAPENINLVSSYNGSNNNDRFLLTLSPSGNSLRLTLDNSSGGSVIAVATSLATWSPVSGVVYEFMVVLDSVAGTVRVFVDGILLGTNSPGPWTRGGILSADHVGSCPVTYNASNGFYHDFITFDDAQETGNYTPGYTVPGNIYDETKISLPQFLYSGLGAVQSFLDFLTTETGPLRYIFNGLYWNGTWSISDGTIAESSSKADVLTNIGSLPFSDSLDIDLFFNGGNTQESITDLTVSYNGQAYSESNPTIVTSMPLYMKQINTFDAKEFKTGTTEIKYSILYRGIYYWLNGGVVEDGGIVEDYTKANTLLELQAFLATMPIDISPDSGVQIVVYVHSDDGTETPEIESFTIGIDYWLTTEKPGTCLVTGLVTDNSCNPIDGAKVEFESADYFNNEYFVGPKSVFFTNAAGEFHARLYETETTGQKVSCLITYTDFDGNEISKSYKDLIIENITVKSLHQIVIDSAL